MQTLSLPLSNQLLVLTAPHAAASMLLELTARLSLSGELRVLDAGNRFNVYPVARIIRRYSANLSAALARIQLARAFTCYQVTTMLADMPCDDVRPLLVFDLLATFYDESVNLDESSRLLQACLVHLQRLSRSAPVVVSARPPAPRRDGRTLLIETLQSAASGAWQLEALPAPSAPTLWEQEA